jgi:NAD(P)-dependent dehydrogenase (short-subunit alcohol dehydrogenase family)
MAQRSVLDELFGVAGKFVVVTGGSRGIGFAIAEGFLRAGARVCISSRDADACARAVDELSQHGDCYAIAANLATADGRAVLADGLSERESRIDVLVNNAGALWAAQLAEFPESGWDKVFDLNLKGTFFLVQALLPLIKAAATPANPARVINIGSIQGFQVPRHETYSYSASKAGLHQLTRHLASQLAADAVTVNAIAPGMFPSKILKGTLEQHGEAAVVARVPLGRLVSPSDMAGASLYLSSAAGSYLTGVILPVEGGTATTF